MTTLRLNALTKFYPGAGQPTLRDLDLTLDSGTLTALLGPSGTGKTTVMKLIAGLIAPSSGAILLDGQPITSLPPERRGIAMVFQNPLLFPHLTVAGNIAFGLKMRGLSSAKVAPLVSEMLDRVRLTGLGDRRLSQLSGGQQQRAALARALILQPRVLLLDEPLSNLDPSLRDEMRALIRTLQRETRITTLVVTHDQAEAVALADQIALLLDGRLAQHGPPEAFYRRPATLSVAQFFGGVNFIPGRAQGKAFNCALGPLMLSEAALQGDCILTIRPEALRLGPGPNSRSARIEEIAFLGTQTRVVLTVEGLHLQALTGPEEARSLHPGADITVSLPPEVLWLLPVAEA
jgi:putative spermidine/putrescine transport system ATP-binding protein